MNQRKKHYETRKSKLIKKYYIILILKIEFKIGLAFGMQHHSRK